MNKGEYNQWVNDRISDLEQHNRKLPVMTIIDKLYGGKYSVCKQRYGENYNGGSILYGNLIITWDMYERTVSIHHNKYHTYGVAKCQYGDNFDLKTGIAIAWARYNRMAVPDVDLTINRNELKNGDMFISSVNKSNVVTFIGWIPNSRNGLVGKWAIILDGKRKPLKTQIADEVVKMN